jgi:hypothetical protein
MEGLDKKASQSEAERCVTLLKMKGYELSSQFQELLTSKVKL